MDFNACTQCGKAIEGSGILFRKRNFCSDECCETFEEHYLVKGEPQLEELDEDVEEEFDDLEFVETGTLDEDAVFLDDDDFDLEEDNF